MRLDGPQFARLHDIVCETFESTLQFRLFVTSYGLMDRSPHRVVSDGDTLDDAAQKVLTDVNDNERIDRFLRALRRERPSVARVQEFASAHTTGPESTLDTLLPILDRHSADLRKHDVLLCAEQARPPSADPHDDADDPGAVDMACMLAVYPPGDDGVYPVQRFVRLLAANAGIALLSQELEAWLEESIIRLAPAHGRDEMRDQLAHAAPLPDRAGVSVLLIRVRPDMTARCIVDAWLYRPGRAAERIGDVATVTEHDLPATVIAHCEEASRRILHGTLCVELMLPRHLIVQPVECWAIEDDLGECFELCVDFNIVVRPLERWTAGARYIKRLTDHWRMIDDQTVCRISGQLPPPADATVCLFTACTCEANTAKTLAMVNSVVCGVLEEAPGPTAARSDAYQALLAAGLPVILWLRSTPGDAERSQLRQVIDNRRVLELSGCVHDLRAQGITSDDWHVGRHVTLVWDDPTRQPPQSQFRNPGDE